MSDWIQLIMNIIKREDELKLKTVLKQSGRKYLSKLLDILKVWKSKFKQ